MISKDSFIKATEEYNTFEKRVPAYYFRRAFSLSSSSSVKLMIAVCGFYELYLDGEKITRGFLSPYISNTNDFVYYDEYDAFLNKGEHVIGVMLGNGLQNNPGGYIWDFDIADFRSAPTFSMTVRSGEQVLLCSDSSFKIAPSPIRSDDYRFGEYYDANYEIEGWNEVGFDDSTWENALPAIAPKGEVRKADIAPIVKEREIAPIQIIPCDDGYIYDFGECNAGVCRLSINGDLGQKVELRYADALKNGDIYLSQLWFVRDLWERDKDIVHKDTYICKGVGREVYQPSFTYHGFRYAKVSGIKKEQATRELLTYLVYHTELATRGDFKCSSCVATALQEMTRRSILSNFHHFPTDCPQREKNGWTADASLTSETALINFNPERNYREWLRSVCKAQREDGVLPGIVPTDRWGYSNCNGPAWDSVLAWIPYYTYIYRGETDMITECAPTFMTYLRYLRSQCDERGLLHIGLGDWCHVGGIDPKSPLIVTDSITAMDIASKIATALDAVNMREEAEYARNEASKYREDIRRGLIDFNTMRVMGECQTSQAMALYYGVFNEDEKVDAFENLLNMIHDCDDHIDVGVLGGRVIFHTLTQFGHSDLAYKMITREDYPSYGNWVKRGATTLWECFNTTDDYSMNHHFWGDISAWFIKCLAGIRLNPNKNNVNEVLIAPSFIDALDSVSAYHIAPRGKISVSWKREKDRIILEVEIPKGVYATAQIEPKFCFENGENATILTSGKYNLVRKN